MQLSVSDSNVISDTFLFAGLGAEELRLLVSRLDCLIEVFERDSVIFSPDRFRKDLGIVLSGRVRVTKAKGNFVVSELKTGDLFGAAALFNDERDYVSTLTSVSKTRIVFLDQDTVQQMLEAYPVIRTNYIRYLSGRIRFLSDKLDSLSCGSGEKKLTEYLLDKMASNGVVAPECSMTELAGRLNMGRATLYRELQKLEDMRILTRRGKEIIVHSPELLKEL